MAHVEALDTQRGLAQAQRRLQLGQGLGAGIVIGRPPQPVTGQILGGRTGDGLLQRTLRPPLRHCDVDRPLAHGGQPAAEEIEIGRRLGDQHPAWYLGADGPVDLGQHETHELGCAEVLHLLGHKAAVADDPAPADVEDLHRRLQRVLGDADDIEVLGPLRHHLLGLGCLAGHRDAVPQAGGALELEGVGGIPHLGVEPVQHGLGVAGEKAHEILDVAVVGRVVDGA